MIHTQPSADPGAASQTFPAPQTSARKLILCSTTPSHCLQWTHTQRLRQLLLSLCPAHHTSGNYMRIECSTSVRTPSLQINTEIIRLTFSSKLSLCRKHCFGRVQSLCRRHPFGSV